MRAGLIPVVALAAFYATLLARKLPYLKKLNERGVKPIACSVCMSAWMSLLFALLLSSGSLGHWDWSGWLEALAYVAASAGVAFWLLEAYSWLHERLGWKDEPTEADYKEPL